MPKKTKKHKLTPDIIRSLHQHFAQSEYGKTLQQNIRYGRYMPKDFWAMLLGDDINNLNHALVVHNIALNFIRECNLIAGETGEKRDWAQFNERETALLLLAAITHDWAESVTKDIIKDLKTETQEKEEMKWLNKITKEILGDFKEGAFTDDVQYVVKNIIENQTSKLGQAFCIIENIGYMKTALTAWEISRQYHLFENNLHWLTVNVLMYHVRTLSDFRETYPPIDRFLNENQELISKIFQQMPNVVFEKYEPHERDIKRRLFAEAKEFWFNHLKQSIITITIEETEYQSGSYLSIHSLKKYIQKLGPFKMVSHKREEVERNNPKELPCQRSW